MKKAIILAAGSGTRWGNYLGVPKQMIVIEGEPLLVRTIRQIKERGIKDEEIAVSVPQKGYFGEIGVDEIVGKSEMEIYKFLNVEDHFSDGTLLFWGDNYFTDEAMDIIFADKNPFRFFGRAGGSQLTGKPYGEIFAVKANKMIFDKARELEAMSGELQRCATWELYRLICRFPLTQHIVGDYYTDINDWTDDFDYPADYDKWIEARTQASIFDEFYKRVKNVLHVGGFAGDDIYQRKGIDCTFVEPIPQYASIIKARGFKVIQKAVSNERGKADFYITTKEKRSSLRKSDVPGEIKETIKVDRVLLKDIQEGFDGLVVDAQGETYWILEQGDLSKFNAVICEVSEKPRYESEKSKEEVEKLLSDQGFSKVGEKKHGKYDIYDILFIKQ